MNTDMITLQVIMNNLYSITDEMNTALVRTAYSTNIKDRRDCSCAVYTAEGQVVSQTELGSPVHLGIMPSALDKVFESLEISDLEEGDHVIVNIPYPTGPGHLNDITMVTPVYIDGEIRFLVANMAHHVDVGGYAPGSMASGLREIFQEGLQIPPVKIVKRGTIDRELMSLITQNVRTPIEVEGDLCAQMACNNVGKKRLRELAEKYGWKPLASYMEAQFDYSEKRMKAGLASLPGGVYEFEDYIEGTPRTEEKIPVRVKVTIGPEQIGFDFSGTSPQVDESLNSNLACVKSACYYVVKVLIDPGLPPNAGSYRPIEIMAPEGTVVNSKPPAAIGNATIITAPKIVDVIMGALTDVFPDRIAAASNGVTSLINLGGINTRTGKLFNYIETYAGGQGGMPGQDGMDAVQCHMTNTRNAPVEVIESTYPIMIRKYGLVPDSDGPGTYRGGLGMNRELTALSEKTTLTVSTDRMKTSPWGVFGGRSGGRSSCLITRPDGSTEKLAYSKITMPVETGSSISISTPGAGGFGDPLKRDPTRVLFDVEEELISPKRACEEYGVVLFKDTEGNWKIDEPATAKRRETMAGSPTGGL